MLPAIIIRDNYWLKIARSLSTDTLGMMFKDGERRTENDEAIRG